MGSFQGELQLGSHLSRAIQSLPLHPSRKLVRRLMRLAERMVKALLVHLP